MLRLWNVPPGFHLLHPFALIQAVGILKEKTIAPNVNNTVFPSEGWQWAVRAVYVRGCLHISLLGIMMMSWLWWWLFLLLLVLSSLPLFSPHHFDPSSRAVEQSSSRAVV